MAPRKINWTNKANLERQDILDYWIIRNMSKIFSIKLNKLFVEATKQIAKNPLIGRKTEFENVRVKIVREYLLFYEYDKKSIKLLCVWDGRRDKKTLEIL
jgi:plasmid stabilization system protein ParE